MRISSTLSQAGGNFARPTKYSMILSLPTPLRTVFGDSLDVLCKTVQAPGITNEPYEIKIKGHTIKIPGRTNQNQEIQITFYVDEDYKVRKMFQDWILSLDNRTPVARSGRNAIMAKNKDYYGELELIGRDFTETSDKTISFMFEDVYPINVGELDFDTSGKDTISEITITFAYSRYNTKNKYSSDFIENTDADINNIKG